MSRADLPRHALPLRLLALGWFLVLFTKELLLANIAVAKSVLLQPRAALAPGFLTYDLRGLTPFEIVVLTHCITLTPGTTSVEIAADNTEVVLHALDARDPEAVRASVLHGLEKPLLRWTR
jgi:multicomponent Na+:H+ antiporter subunit E